LKPIRKTPIDRDHLPPLRRTTLRRILRYLQPHWRRGLAVLACILTAAALNLAAPLFIKRIIDVAIPLRSTWLLSLYCGAMIAGSLVAGLVQVVQKYCAETIGQRAMLDMRVAIYKRLHEMPFAYFTQQQPGEAVSHVLNDVQGIGGVVSGTLVDIVQNAVVLTSTLLFVVALDWRLSVVAAAALPAFVMPARRVGKAHKALRRTIQSRVSELTGILTETLSVSGALLVKVFGAEGAEVRRFQQKAGELERLALRQTLVSRFFQLLLGLFEAIGPAIVLGVGGLLVMRGEMALGTVVAFVTVLKRLYGPASDLASVHVDLMTSYAYFERAFDVVDQVPSIRDVESAVDLGTIDGDVELRNVSFGYDERGNAVRGINLAIPAGKTVALVGPSGAGKSTIGSLVMRLYDPLKGSVLVDGIDVRQASLASLRANIACVTQDTFLMHATVLENLRYGRPEASLAEVERAARQAQIHDTIAALPDGYDTIVGERGYRFSAGERQRIAIARAILKNPRILILDEATSSLDSASERLVQQALAPVLKTRTSLVIAHRLSTIRDADLIVVIDRGRIVECGTHDALLSRVGVYARLWQSQASARRVAPLEPAVAAVAYQPASDDNAEYNTSLSADLLALLTAPGLSN
jgi:ATP-binding cassette subfamily B protein